MISDNAHYDGEIFTIENYAEIAKWCNKQNDGYYIEDFEADKFKICKLPKLTLEELKQQKLDEVKTISDGFRDTNLNKNMYITSSLGFEADADKDSQNNAWSLHELLKSKDSSATVGYKDKNNILHDLNKDQMYTLYLEMVQNGTNLFNQKWELELAINGAKTEEELNKIEIKFTMMDFSKK